MLLRRRLRASPVKRRPLYCVPTIVAAIYTTLLFVVICFSINPLMAHMHPGSWRYHFGAFLDRISWHAFTPLRPLFGLLQWFQIEAGEFAYFFVFIYMLLLACFPVILFRRVFPPVTNTVESFRLNDDRRRGVTTKRV